ncbi:HemK family protein methyltransferase [Bradyrhizobium sp. 930_D9_N1_4]|uniref:HemK family protein methyltransferase n=1 Tax=Bradyrhizobium sp. 930_D9_N1_4 TaxID=3240374 RepID=UPI003F8AB78C
MNNISVAPPHDELLGSLFERAVQTLEGTGVRDPQGDVLALIAVAAAEAGGLSKAAFADILDTLVEQRAHRVPLEYLTKTASLGGLEFWVGPGAFIPRRQSETYLQAALDFLGGKTDPLVLDLCTGVGALALAVAHHRPDAGVFGIELSNDALVYAHHNRRQRLSAGDKPIQLIQGDVNDPGLLSDMDARFDLVLANPPYVPPEKTIPPEWAQYQPSMALYSDENGLAVLKSTALMAARLLKPGGAYIVEHGDEQGQAIHGILKSLGAFVGMETQSDQENRPRWTKAIRLDTTRSASNGPRRPQSHLESGKHSGDSWFRQRLNRTSSMIDRCFEEGVTGHVFERRDGKSVQLRNGDWATEFISCSYLGLESHPMLTEAARAAIDEFGVHFSSSRNRMMPPFLPLLDEGLGQIHGGLHCLSFSSVSNVHIGILPLLGAGGLASFPIAKAGPLFLIERTAHASMQILRGVLEQIGPVRRFDLAAPDSLEEGLKAGAVAGRTPVILTDGVGSMGGLIDVVHLQRVAAEFGGYLYVDDAHGTSIAGDFGQGYAASAFGRAIPRNVIVVGSLSKAFGGAGGYVALPEQSDVASARKSANPLVFGHSIMLPMLAANVASIRLHLDGTVLALQKILRKNLQQFDRETQSHLENAGLPTPIRGLRIPNEKLAFAAAKKLRQEGILLLPAFYPTVAQGTGLLRFAVSASHSPDQLSHAADVIRQVSAM